MTTDNSEWMMVPREPTWPMKIAGRDGMIDTADDDNLDLSTDDAGACYRAMLEAAPTPPSAPGVRVRDALLRQTDNMAFVLNHAGMPQELYEKLKRELAGDRASLSTLEPSPQPIADGGWRGMDSAPKDGTYVLVCDGMGAVMARFLDDYDQWWPLNNDPTDSWGSDITPTHWMPLPAPPAALNEGSGQ